MLKGTLDDFSLPDIFRLLSFAKKTGRLDIARSAGTGRVFFVEGEVSLAESSLSRDPLGQRLIRAGALTDSQLRKALDQHAATGQRVGDILVGSGMVTPEQIEAAIRGQIEDAVFDLLRWELGEFGWEPDARIDVEIPLAVSVENLIMEASRRLDELEVIRRKIPSTDVVLRMAPKAPEGAVEINITPEEWRVLVLVDGTRTIADIAAMVGMDDFQAMRSFYGLVSAGLAEVHATHAAVAPVEAEPVAAPEPVARVEAEPVAEAVPVTEPEPVVHAEPEPVAHAEPEPVTEPEPEPLAEAAPVAEPEPEPVAEAEPVAVAEPEPVIDAAAEAEPVAEPEPVVEPDAEAEPVFDAEPVLDAEPVIAAAEDAPPDNWFEEPSFEEPSFEEPSVEEPSVEAFDVPGAEELTTTTPEVDSFLNSLMDDPAIESAEPVAEIVEAESAEPPAPPAPQPAGAPAAPPGQPRVDRSAVVRELAGLFSDEERPRPRAVPSKKAAGEGEEADKKRVEDDDQVTKGLISRFIDGVKGL